MRSFFTGGLEIDGRAQKDSIARFLSEFATFRERLGVAKGWGAGVELKFRRLGRHRADGLYYPREMVLVLDLGTTRSFAHEFGHLIDFRDAFQSSAASWEEPFTPFHQMLLSRMARDGRDDPRLSRRRGRLSWSYFASRAECFARTFEQFAAELLPQPSAIAGEPERYRADPLFLSETPPELARYFGEILSRGPGTPEARLSVPDFGSGVPGEGDAGPGGGPITPPAWRTRP